MQRSESNWEALCRLVEQAWPADRWRDLGVVVGCSGGADSVALVELLSKLRQPRNSFRPPPTQQAARAPQPPRGFVLVAHFNHGIRGEAADADEQHVRDLAKRHDFSVVVGHARSSRRDEASMREERTAFLIDAAHSAGARYLTLAHSADDSVETLLHHLFRGTGPGGLTGIGSPRAIADDLVLIRPLLAARRDVIRDALTERGITWREDDSNSDVSYRRNWIRHELIPMIEQHYPQVTEAVGRAIDGQRQWRDLVDRLAASWLDANRLRSDPATLRRDPMADRAVLTAALQHLWDEHEWPRGEMTRDHWLRLTDMLTAGDDQRISMPGDVDVVASGETVTLDRTGRTEPNGNENSTQSA